MFKSAAPTQFWRYNNNKKKLCWNKHRKRFRIGGQQEGIETFVTIFLKLFIIVSRTNQILYMKKKVCIFVDPLYEALWFDGSRTVIFLVVPSKLSWGSTLEAFVPQMVLICYFRARNSCAQWPGPCPLSNTPNRPHFLFHKTLCSPIEIAACVLCLPAPSYRLTSCVGSRDLHLSRYWKCNYMLWSYLMCKILL